MSKTKRKPKRPRKKAGPPRGEPDETQTAEVATVAWAVTVTMVTVCDLVAIAAHLYSLGNPASKLATVLGQMMLLGGAMIGAGTLALTPAVYQLRREPPPTGFSVFAVCAAVAPILSLITRAMQQ